MVIALNFLYFIVNILEAEWGEFRTTLYVLVAVLLTIAFRSHFTGQIIDARRTWIDAFLWLPLPSRRSARSCCSSYYR